MLPYRLELRDSKNLPADEYSQVRENHVTSRLTIDQLFVGSSACEARNRVAVFGGGLMGILCGNPDIFAAWCGSPFCHRDGERHVENSSN